MPRLRTVQMVIENATWEQEKNSLLKRVNTIQCSGTAAPANTMVARIPDGAIMKTLRLFIPILSCAFALGQSHSASTNFSLNEAWTIQSSAHVQEKGEVI